jgi:hypothetical protein
MLLENNVTNVDLNITILLVEKAVLTALVMPKESFLMLMENLTWNAIDWTANVIVRLVEADEPVLNAKTCIGGIPSMENACHVNVIVMALFIFNVIVIMELVFVDQDLEVLSVINVQEDIPAFGLNVNLVEIVLTSKGL